MRHSCTNPISFLMLPTSTRARDSKVLHSTRNSVPPLFMSNKCHLTKVSLVFCHPVTPKDPEVPIMSPRNSGITTKDFKEKLNNINIQKDKPITCEPCDTPTKIQFRKEKRTSSSAERFDRTDSFPTF